MKRIKITKPVITSRAEAEAYARDIASYMNDQRIVTANMDASITSIREEHEAELTSLQTTIDEKTTTLQAWADGNPAEFNGAKSMDMVHAIIGYRTGQHQIKTASGWSWDRVLEKIRTIPAMLSYIRTKEEINKQALIADRDTLGPEALRQFGCRIVQDESFFVEPKLTDQDKAITKAA